MSTEQRGWVGTGRGNNLAGSRESRRKGRKVGNMVNDKRWQVTGLGVVTEQGDGQATEVATDPGCPSFLSEMDRGKCPLGLMHGSVVTTCLMCVFKAHPE